ncbi:hypothetical protein TrRE_jg10003 [Triparma retinervis]|uniref:Uncharacterized protein n=1 Tax=Triparma retinervis TaxID=2557542 RepID=A0A9W6ZZL5_9STRA|nr:hypothetical protein TrRE_jg10003 [Triparma retinervis]
MSMKAFPTKGSGGAAGGKGGTKGKKDEDNITFRVVPSEDLYLQGTYKNVLRVPEGKEYSCVMTIKQKMSSLFKHYAKYHGLKRDDLEFHFVDLVRPNDTPEGIMLEDKSEIAVRHKTKLGGSGGPPGMNIRTVKEKWATQLGNMMKYPSTMDGSIVMATPNSSSPPREMSFHYCVFAARCPYIFTPKSDQLGLIDPNPSLLGITSQVGGRVYLNSMQVNEYTPGAMLLVREFLYKADFEGVVRLAESMEGSEGCGGTGGAGSSGSVDAVAVANIYIECMSWASRWGLKDLVEIAKYGCGKNLSVDNVVQYLCGLLDMDAETEEDNLDCMDFIIDNFQSITKSQNFQDQIQLYPDLVMPILQKAAEKMPDTPQALIQKAEQRAKRSKKLASKGS